jgi:hypothetical protein
MNSLGFLVLLASLSSSFAYIITVDSHAEECFFDAAQGGSKLGENLVIGKI